MWIMSVVKCKSFVNKLKRAVAERKKRHDMEELERMNEEMINSIQTGVNLSGLNENNVVK